MPDDTFCSTTQEASWLAMVKSQVHLTPDLQHEIPGEGHEGQCPKPWSQGTYESPLALIGHLGGQSRTLESERGF